MEIKDKHTTLSVENSKIINSSFSNADLSGSVFKDVGLRKIKIEDANLDSACISNSNLTALTIKNCNLAGMSIDGVLVKDLFAALSLKSVAKVRKSKKEFAAEDYLPSLEAVIKQLETKSWFKREGWRGRVSLYKKHPPVVVSLHIFKENWFNDEGVGIHFETFIGPKEQESSSVDVVLHLLHTPTIPGTKIKRIELSKLVIDKTHGMIAEWPGYQFKVGKYGMQPFSKTVEFDGESLSTLLTTEFARLCRNLGPAIDNALKKLQF